MLFEKITAVAITVFLTFSGVTPGFANRDELFFRVPVIDGTESTVALEAAFVSGFSGYSYDTILRDTFHTGIDNAFERLCAGSADIVLSPYYEKSRIDTAKERGINLTYEFVAYGNYRTREEFNYMDSGLVYYCLYFNKDTKKQNTLDFVDFMLSQKGQAAVSRGGFKPIIDIKLPVAEKPPYETLGTGEPRPEDFEKSVKFSALSFSLSNYGSSAEYAHNIEFFLLNNDLTNTKLEKEINDWIEEEITTKKLTEKFMDCVVCFQAINGYLEVVISQTYGEGGSYMPDSPVSVWNLKTGERVTRFSDLFYKGTDFLPALKEAYKTVFPDRLSANIKTEPQRFYITDFLFGDMDYRYIDDEYGGETIEDIYKLPINFLSPVMDYSPVWTYCDMAPFFTVRHLDPNEWRHVSDIALPEYGSKAVIYNENFREWEIVSSRFLGENEIESRNSELKKLYDFIEKSKEYKTAKPDNEWENIINSTIEFSKDGETAVIKTSFGSFMRNRETGEMKGPGDDVRLSGKELFVGSVDVDFDGHNALFMTGNYYFDGVEITSTGDYYDGYGNVEVEYYAQGIDVVPIGCTVKSILYRGNDIININYDKVNADEPDVIYHFNSTYELFEFYSGNEWRTSLEEINADKEGIYHPSYTEYNGEDIAVYVSLNI